MTSPKPGVSQVPNYDVYTAGPNYRVKIAQLCKALHITEELEQRPMSEHEAGRLIRELTDRINAERASKK